MGRAIDLEPGDGFLDHNICPGVPCPEIVLIARMIGGSYLLRAYPQREPAAFVVSADADLLHDALQAAFGYSTAEGVNGNSDSAPEDNAPLTKRVPS